MTQKKSLLIDEPMLRAQNRCSEFRHFGGRVELPLKTAALEFVYMRIVLDLLRMPVFNYKDVLNTHLAKAEQVLGIKSTFPISEGQELMRHVAIGVDEVFQLLSPRMYVPVFGGFEYKVRVLSSVVTLRVAGLLVTNTMTHDRPSRTYHAVTFSPYSSARDMQNDIVQTMKVLSLRQANPLKPTGLTVPLVKLHIFSTNSTVGLTYNYSEVSRTTDDRKWAQYVEQPIRLMEEQIHYPVVPCNFTCPFKTQCNISPTGGYNV